MSDNATAFDSACIMWTSQLMMESLTMLAYPWDSSLEVMRSPTIYHALKAGLSVCPDYRREDLKYFAPKELYESAVSGVSSETFLLNSIIKEDPIQVAKSACRRGNSLAFLAARGVHRLHFTIDFHRLGSLASKRSGNAAPEPPPLVLQRAWRQAYGTVSGTQVTSPRVPVQKFELRVFGVTADNYEWERFATLKSEWECYLHRLLSRSKRFKVPFYPIGIDFEDSLERDILNMICLDWWDKELQDSDSRPSRFHCNFDMTNWEMRICK